jgi:hypothetical protein
MLFCFLYFLFCISTRFTWINQNTWTCRSDNPYLYSTLWNLSGDKGYHSLRQNFKNPGYSNMNIKSLPQATQEKLEAAAFRQLLAHLDSRKDVQNIDLMNLAGFCRNCLSKWYQAAAGEQGLELSQDDVRERIYGMTYEQWKKDYQR